jgi:hypothetical protein
MSTELTYSKLRQVAVEAFRDCRWLAQTSRPGCIQARAALKAAEKHGLADKPYIVRNSMMYGWGGVAGNFHIEPLRGTREPRGGSRAGAGRKTADGATGMTRVNVMLDAASIEKLRALGGGNLSVGIRTAARRLCVANAGSFCEQADRLVAQTDKLVRGA